MGLALLKTATTQSDVEVAWATYRALILCQHEDRSLLKNAAHQLAVSTAKTRFGLLFDDWIG